MSGLPYYKRYPGDALQGMRGMTLEERGAYNTLIDLMYDAGEPVPDQERWVCAHLNCDPRVWRRIRTSLLASGKLHLVEGRLFNRRVEIELTSTELRREVRRRSGAAGGHATAERIKKAKPNKRTKPARAAPVAAASQSQKPESESAAAAARAPARKTLSFDTMAGQLFAAAPPAAQAKCNGDPRKIEWKLKDAAGDGADVVAIFDALMAYYRDSRQQDAGGRYAKPPHFAVKDMASGEWQPPQAAVRPRTNGGAPPASAAPSADVDAHLAKVWRGRVQDWRENPGRWKVHEYGPRPDTADCRAPAAVLAEFDLGHQEGPTP